MSEIIKVMIVDDQQIIIDGITALLKIERNIKICGGCNNPQLLTEKITECDPNVILMDFNMPGKDGIECLKEVHTLWPEMKVLMLTGYDDLALIREALKNGAAGYVKKNIDKEELLKAIVTVVSGSRFLDSSVQEKIIQSFIDTESGPNASTFSGNVNSILSKREQEVLRLIVDGKKSLEIAEQLFISINTVDTHRKNILAKCEVKNTAQLVAIANKNGWI